MLVRCLFVFVAAIFCTDASAESHYAYELEEVKPKFVSDGDTASISIRMYGIDTPESAQLCERANGSCWQCGDRAERVLSGMIKNQESTFLFTGDVTYGRPVATIKIGAKDINKEMVRQGYAVVFDRFLTTAMKAEYFAAQDEAKAAKLGIWQGEFIMPWDWRNGDRLSCEQS